MFTMDTTGSMADEIRASKAIARQIIDITRSYDVDYILSAFNDPSKHFIALMFIFVYFFSSSMVYS